MRRDLTMGMLPRPESVRVEEFVNFFDFKDSAPDESKNLPFHITTEAAPSKFGSGKHLLRVGIKGKRLKPKNAQPQPSYF